MVFAVVTPDKIQLPPGTVMRLEGDWQLYRTLADQIGDLNVPRIKYRPGEILLMTPSPEHGRDADITADVAKELLVSFDHEYTAFTPISLELPEHSGIEPDYCFYIDNWEAVSGKKRINWEQDPPPDLVIEIDVTSYTSVDDYLPYQVPEIWLFRKNNLKIFQYENGEHVLKDESKFFPGLPLAEFVAECSQIAIAANTGRALRELRRKIAAAG
jgi:Uma2 family endonuclease